MFPYHFKLKCNNFSPLHRVFSMHYVLRRVAVVKKWVKCTRVKGTRGGLVGRTSQPGRWGRRCGGRGGGCAGKKGKW